LDDPPMPRNDSAERVGNTRIRCFCNDSCTCHGEREEHCCTRAPWSARRCSPSPGRFSTQRGQAPPEPAPPSPAARRARRAQAPTTSQTVTTRRSSTRRRCV